MLDQLYADLGTREIPGEPEALERLAKRVRELVIMNGRSWVRANRDILLMQWRMALGLEPAEEVLAMGEEESDE